MKSLLFFLLLVSLKFTTAQSSAGVVETITNLDPCPGAPPAPMVDGVTFCPNDTKILVVQNPVSSCTYNWYDQATGGNLLGTGTSFTTPVLTISTSFYVEAVNTNCASARTYVPATLISPPYPIVHDTTICPGEYAALTILNPIYDNYNWYTELNGGFTGLTVIGPTLITPPLYQTTVYYVDGSVSCPGHRTPVTVYVIAAPVSNDATVCPGNAATLTVENPEASQTYTWYSVETGGNALGTGTSFITVPVFSGTTYFVENTNAICDNLRTPVHVNLFEQLDSPRVRIKNVSGSSVTFTWNPVAGAAAYKVSVDGSAYESPSSGSTGTTHTIGNLPRAHIVSISVIALGQHGCDDSYPGHSKGGTYADGFYIPSAFTPNGDGLNDMLTPVFPSNATLDHFTIYNRWGQKVFSTSVIGEGWDGKLQGINQLLGTYTWICRYRLGSGKAIIEKGTFTIIH
ncbi:MAG: gliding motility-associated C-terminal domain-containing protein [Ferruginibacter sp.]